MPISLLKVVPLTALIMPERVHSLILFILGRVRLNLKSILKPEQRLVPARRFKNSPAVSSAALTTSLPRSCTNIGFPPPWIQETTVFVTARIMALAIILAIGSRTYSLITRDEIPPAVMLFDTALFMLEMAVLMPSIN